MTLGLFTAKSIDTKMQVKVFVALALVAMVLSGLSYGFLMDLPKALLAFFWTNIGYQPATSFSPSTNGQLKFEDSRPLTKIVNLKVNCLAEDGFNSCDTISQQKPDSFFDTSISIRHKQRFSPSSGMIDFELKN